MAIRTDIIERKEDILKWIDEKQSKAFMCRELKCKPETLQSYLIKMGIEYEGNQGLKGKKTSSKYKTSEEYVKSEGNIKSHRLRLKLIKDGIKKEECEVCKNSVWLDEPIPLELHHKDGNHYNNNIENLELLCPNCHAYRHKQINMRE